MKTQKQKEQQFVSGWMETNPDQLKNLVVEAVNQYCLAKDIPGRKHATRDINIAKALSSKVTQGDFQAFLEFVQGKDREKRSMFLKGPSQGENSLMHFISEAVSEEIFEDGADMTPRELLEPGLLLLAERYKPQRLDTPANPMKAKMKELTDKPEDSSKPESNSDMSSTL
ncbi:MAG: hypothetical protein QNK11_05210 [Legionella sp.]|nr:hypothetical protein [Legionella sp.]